MMSESELQKMYHSWAQGNENYVRDWVDFLEWSAEWNKTTQDEMMRQLQKYYWFIRE